jgi:hypothetical protein
MQKNLVQINDKTIQYKEDNIIEAVTGIKAKDYVYSRLQ